MKSRFMCQADDASLARQVREHQDFEYAELRDGVQAGSAEGRRELAARNDAGVGRDRWKPGRGRRV